jgi:hypothetical protein
MPPKVIKVSFPNPLSQNLSNEVTVTHHQTVVRQPAAQGADDREESEQQMSRLIRDRQCMNIGESMFPLLTRLSRRVPTVRRGVNEMFQEVQSIYRF